ncbi:unnamed protein product, partial [Allacma fusca]
VIVPPVITLVILAIVKAFPSSGNPTSLEISFKAYERVERTTVLFNCVPESNLCSSFERFMKKSRPIEEIPDTSMVSFLLDETEKSISNVNSKYILAIDQSDRSVEGDGKNLTVLFNNQPLHTPALGL